MYDTSGRVTTSVILIPYYLYEIIQGLTPDWPIPSYEHPGTGSAIDRVLILLYIHDIFNDMVSNQVTNLTCQFCGNHDLLYTLMAYEFNTGEPFELWKCNNYNALFTLPRLSDRELEKYYEKTYYGKRKSLVDQTITRERVGALLRLAGNKPKKVLDVGCGNGLFLLGLQKKGWDISGTELAPESHINHDVSRFVCKGPIEKCERAFAAGSFDIITMWHTLEHFTDPKKYLAEAQKLLKPGGLLVIEVPNFTSLQSRITGRHWYPLYVPQHQTHFSPQALALLLKKSGFRPIHISHGTFFYDVFGFVQSVLNTVCRKKNIFFDIVNGKFGTLRQRKIGTRDFAVTVLLAPPLSLISLVFYAIEKLMGRAGTMRFIARKI